MYIASPTAHQNAIEKVAEKIFYDSLGVII